MKFVNKFLGYDKYQICKQELRRNGEIILIGHPANIDNAALELMSDTDTYTEQNGEQFSNLTTGLELKAESKWDLLDE